MKFRSMWQCRPISWLTGAAMWVWRWLPWVVRR